MPPGTREQPEESGTDRFSFEMSTPTYPGPGRQPPGAGTRAVTLVSDRYTFGVPNPGPARQSLGTGTQPATDRFAYKPPSRTRTRPGFDRVQDEWPDMSYGRLVTEDGRV